MGFNQRLNRPGKKVTPWYLRGGIAKANCIGAYKAVGAASQAASYINLVTPGTYNISGGATPPTWASATGWTFDGANDFLATGIIPDGKNWTYIVKFSNTTSDQGSAVGVFDTNLCVAIYPRRTALTNSHYCYNSSAGAFSEVYPILAAGVMAKTNLKMFSDGYQDQALADSSPGANTTQVLIGKLSAGGGQMYAGKIQYVAVYNTTLTDAQILAVTKAIASEFVYPASYVVTDDSATGANGTAYIVNPGGATDRAFINGRNAYINLFSAALASKFNGNEGSLMVRAKVRDATDWTDGLQKDLIRLDNGADTAIVAFDREGAADEIRCYFQPAGGHYHGVTTTDLNGTMDWFTAAVTWSRTNTRARGYVNGVQQGLDVNNDVNWSGTLQRAHIGCAYINQWGSNRYGWGGYMGPVLLADRELSIAEVASLHATFTLANAQAILGANLIGWWELDEA